MQVPPIRTALAAAIKAEMAGQDVSQREMSLRLKQDPNWLNRRLKAKVPLTIDEVDTIAGQLKVSVGALLAAASERLRRTTLD